MNVGIEKYISVVLADEHKLHIATANFKHQDITKIMQTHTKLITHN